MKRALRPLQTFNGERLTISVRQRRRQITWTAGPWILEVGTDGNATIFPATEKADGKLEKASDTGTVLTVADGSDSKVLQLTIQDTLWGYKLPDTGGAGTTSYTAGGLALIFGAATLLYSHCRRRKEDEASS